MKSALLTALVFCGSSVVFGQAFEGSISVGRQLESNATLGSIAQSAATGGTFNFTDGFNLNFRITLNTWKFFGHEIGYAYNRTHLNLNAFDLSGNLIGTQDQGGMAVHQGFYDFLGYATPEGSRIRPFGAVGVHFSNYVPPGASASYGQGDNKFGFQYGGGVKIKVAGPWGVRFDVHQFTNPKPFSIPGSNGWIRQTELSAGLDFML